MGFSAEIVHVVSDLCNRNCSIRGIKNDKGRRQKKWHFWVVPTTKWPTPPPPPQVVVKVPLYCGKFFICLESPDTEK